MVQLLAEHNLCSVLQIRDIGSGNFGVAKLMRNRLTNELIAVKFIERGERVSFVSTRGWCPARLCRFRLVQAMCWFFY